jgi:hypothetical protein
MDYLAIVLSNGVEVRFDKSGVCFSIVDLGERDWDDCEAMARSEIACLPA